MLKQSRRRLTLLKGLKRLGRHKKQHYAPKSIALLLLMVLSACVPANVPKHLSYTPGPPVLALDGMYDAGVFSVRYPAGWVVVSSPANQPAAVTLVAPDESGIIRLSTHPNLEPMPDEDLPSGMRLHTEQIALSDSTMLTLTLGAPGAEWSAYLVIFEAVARSVVTG